MTEKNEKKFYGMKNDYMFKAVLQENQEVLVNLVATLMGISEDRIVSCVITNPIKLGNSINAKDCVLDIKLELNGNVSIDIEMQLENEGYWPERSLLYWSRVFDSIETGADYSQLKPAYQIGILDFTLFKDSPEFYSEYKLLNVKTGKAYTDKLSIRVLDLTNIKLAREDEKNLARWARIFKAKTMEELKQVAGSTEVMKKMVVTLAKLSEEEEIRQQCEAREKNEMDKRSCFAFGVEQGIERGIEQGIERGIEQGMKRGIEQGIALGKESAILNLVRENAITIEVAARQLDKPVDEIERLLL